MKVKLDVSFARCAAALAVSALLAPATAGADAVDGELVLANYRVVRFEAVDTDRVEVELTADVENLDSGSWESAGVSWTSPYEQLEVIDGSLSFGAVPPYGVVPADDTLVVRFPIAGRQLFLEQLAAGQLGLTLTGTEQTVYNVDTVAVDEPTDLAFDPALSVPGLLVFTSTTPQLDALTVGSLWLIDGELYDPFHLDRAWLPGEVTGVVHQPDGSVEVSTAEIDLEAAIESGTFVVSETRWDTLVETTLDTAIYESLMAFCEDETHLPEPSDPTEPPNTACLFSGLPLRFNDVDFGQGVTLSGELLLRAAPFELEVKIRDSAVRRIATTSEVGWTATLQLEAPAAAALPPTEQRLWTLVLPTYTVLVGPFPVTFTPTLELWLGAEASTAGELRVALQQSSSLGFSAAWEAGALTVDPVVELEPLTLSVPELLDDREASGRAWAAADLSLEIDGVAGPSLRAAAFGELTVSPVDDPWWELSAGAELAGAFEISLLGYDVLRQEIPLVSTASPAAAGTREDGVAPMSGESVRWATALTDGALPTANQRVDPLSDGGVVVAGESPLSQGYLVRLDGRGDVVWERELSGALPRRAVEQRDGTLLVVGETRRDVVWSAGYGVDGDRLWDASWESVDGCNLSTFEPFAEAETLGASMLLVGDAVRNFSFERDPCLIRFDPEGGVVWAKLLESPGSDSLYDVIRLADGDFVAVGSTEADVGDESLLNQTNNGLVVRFDASGAVVWAKAIASRWGLHLRSVVEDDDGRLWITGEVNGTTSDDYPAFFVGRYEPDLGDGFHVLIAQDAAWEDHVDAESGLPAPPWVETGGGDTAYDRGLEIAKLGDGFIVTGSTGLGSDAAAWALKLTEELGVQWMITLDGADLDVWSELADVGDGFVVTGRSESFVPLGLGGELAFLAAKLPYEGRIDLVPESLGVVRYVQPLVFPSYLDDDFDSTDGQQLADAVFEVVDTVLAAVGERPEPLEVTSTVTRLAD